MPGLVELPGQGRVPRGGIDSKSRIELERAMMLAAAGTASGAISGHYLAHANDKARGTGVGAAIGLGSGLASYGLGRLIWSIRNRDLSKTRKRGRRTQGPVRIEEVPIPVPGLIPLSKQGQKDLDDAEGWIERGRRLIGMDREYGFAGASDSQDRERSSTGLSSLGPRAALAGILGPVAGLAFGQGKTTAHNLLEGAGYGAGALGGSLLGGAAGNALGSVMGVTNPGATGLLNVLGQIGGGVGGVMAARRLAQPAPARQRRRQIRQPLKQASLEDAMAGVYSHLPRVRLLDSLVGAGLGAGGGYLTSRLTDKDKKRTAKDHLANTLLGAGVGFGAANLIGDRTRRGITNYVPPYGYAAVDPQDPSLANAPTNPVTRFFRGVIQDKPLYDVDKLLGNSPTAQARGRARYELHRRSLGVHTNNPAADVFAKEHGGEYSLNPKNPEVEKYVKSLLVPDGTDPRIEAQQANANITGLPLLPHGIMASVMGGQTSRYLPMTSLLNPAQHGIVQQRDRWDYTLSDRENAELKKNMGKFLTNRTWRTNKGDINADYIDDDLNNSTVMQSLIKRWLVDNLIADEKPWVRHNILVGGSSPKDPNYYAIPTTGAGTVLPGGIRGGQRVKGTGG